MFPYSDAHGQNFKVFSKRFFAQLRLTQRIYVTLEITGKNTKRKAYKSVVKTLEGVRGPAFTSFLGSHLY